MCSVAEKHNLSLSDLLTWLELPSTREQMALRESACYRHVRLVAALNLSTAVHTTVKLLDTYNKSAPPTAAADPFDPAALRAAIHARKAAWLLYRFSRAVPVNEADLARARSVIRAAPVAPKPIEFQESIEAQETRTPRGVASRDAASPSEPSAARTLVDSSSPSPVAPPGSHSTPHAAASRLASQPAVSPASMEELLSQLEAIAGSLGIDISEFDNLDALEDPAFGAAPGDAPPNSS